MGIDRKGLSAIVLDDAHHSPIGREDSQLIQVSHIDQLALGTKRIGPQCSLR